MADEEPLFHNVKLEGKNEMADRARSAFITLKRKRQCTEDDEDAFILQIRVLKKKMI